MKICIILEDGKTGVNDNFAHCTDIAEKLHNNMVGNHDYINSNIVLNFSAPGPATYQAVDQSTINFIEDLKEMADPGKAMKLLRDAATIISTNILKDFDKEKEKKSTEVMSKRVCHVFIEEHLCKEVVIPIPDDISDEWIDSYAEDKATEMYKNSEIVLDSTDHNGVVLICSEYNDEVTCWHAMKGYNG